MHNYLTILFLLMSTCCFSQEGLSSDDSLSGENLIVSWTLGEVVAGYGGFDKEVNPEILKKVKYTISSTKQTNTSQLIKIPNPNTNFVVVHLKDVDAEELVLTDKNGDTILSKELPKSIKSYELDLQSHKDGVYFLTIIAENHIPLQEYKIIKSTVTK